MVGYISKSEKESIAKQTFKGVDSLYTKHMDAMGGMFYASKGFQ